jgi:hypothetical protein
LFNDFILPQNLLQANMPSQAWLYLVFLVFCTANTTNQSFFFSALLLFLLARVGLTNRMAAAQSALGLDIQGKLRGKTVFVTGGTGFVGKVLIEKILRSTEVERIFVLARAAKDKTAQQRVTTEVFTSPCFDRLRRECADYEGMIQRRIYAVSGDLLKEGLGLSEVDRQRVQDETQVFIHCAASVEFNLPLYSALQQNLVGTSRVFDLAAGARRIESFLHVSTAYVNCNQEGATIIEEKIYPQSFQPLELIQSLQEMSEEKVNSLQVCFAGSCCFIPTF